MPAIESTQEMHDNGGRRLGFDYRQFMYDAHIPERRLGPERRSGSDRRKGLSDRRSGNLRRGGQERRDSHS